MKNLKVNFDCDIKNLIKKYERIRFLNNLMLFAILLFFFLSLVKKTNKSLSELKASKVKLQKSKDFLLKRQKTEKYYLEQVKWARSDPEFIEILARINLSYKKPSEKVLVINESK